LVPWYLHIYWYLGTKGSLETVSEKRENDDTKDDVRQRPSNAAGGVRRDLPREEADFRRRLAASVGWLDTPGRW